MNFKDVLNWLTFIIIVLIAVYLIVFLRGESTACLANPVSYGVKDFNSANGVDLLCSCSIGRIGSHNFITIDADGIHG